MNTGSDDLSAMTRAALEKTPDASLEAALVRWREAPTGEAANDLGTALVKLGHKELAERAYRIALEENPQAYKPYNNLGNLLLERGNVDESVGYLRRAASLAPDQARVWLNLGNALAAQAEDAEAAVAAYERSISLVPTWKAHHNLGALKARLGLAEEAISSFERALSLDPKAIGTTISLAEMLVASGRRREADAMFRDVAKRLPRLPHVAASFLATLEVCYLDDVAADVAEEFLDEWPDDETLLLLYVFILERNGALARAEKRFLARADVSSGPGPLLHLARLRARQFRRADEAEFIRWAERRFPDHPAVLAQKARMLRYDQKLDEAIEVVERLVREPGCSSDAFEVLAGTMLDIGDARSAYEAMKEAERRALSAKHFSRSMLAYVSNAVSGLSAEEVAAEHRGFPSSKAAALGRLSLRLRSLDPDRRLRIGYVSPDFRAHSVGMFIEPILREHDRDRFDIHCYSTTTLAHDFVTERIRAMDLAFTDVKVDSDYALAERVVSDEIDILVDLAGWTSEQRMFAFQMCPAPIRISYLGYPNTTGVEEMQYRITDGWADPPGAERLYSEELIRLGRCAWAFAPVDPPEEVALRPASSPIVFGSFNNLLKVSEETIGLWARVLHAVEGSRLLLKSRQLMHRRARDRILNEFAAHGILPERIELRERTAARRSHLAAYGDVDIALDPFPYNGTTTTCEALLMGVPVVTLHGQTPASRVGHSLMRAIGLSELSCQTEDAYVAKAAELAHDPARVRALRLTLRDRLRASELGDVKDLTRALEGAFRATWARYVASDGAERR